VTWQRAGVVLVLLGRIIGWMVEWTAEYGWIDNLEMRVRMVSAWTGKVSLP